MAPPEIKIPAYLLDRVGAHARTEHPREACGFLTGPSGGSPDRFVPIPNVSSTPDISYVMDPDAVIGAFNYMDAIRHDPLVVYHSHTTSEPTMSGQDVRLASDTDVVYLITSTAKSLTAPTFQAWRIEEEDEGQRNVFQVALDIVDEAHPESPLSGLIEGNRVRLTYESTGQERRTIVGTVGKRSGTGVIIELVRPGGGAKAITIALSRIRALGILSEGASAANSRSMAAVHLREAATRLAACDTLGAREAIAAAVALIPRVMPSPPALPRAYRPRRLPE